MVELQDHLKECYCLPREVDVMWEVVVQVGKGNFVLCPDWLSDDDLVDVIELIPVFIPVKGKQSFISYAPTKKEL